MRQFERTLILLIFLKVMAMLPDYWIWIIYDMSLVIHILQEFGMIDSERQ